jgi:hypothetical protein
MGVYEWSDQWPEITHTTITAGMLTMGMTITNPTATNIKRQQNRHVAHTTPNPRRVRKP